MKTKPALHELIIGHLLILLGLIVITTQTQAQFWIGMTAADATFGTALVIALICIDHLNWDETYPQPDESTFFTYSKGDKT